MNEDSKLQVVLVDLILGRLRVYALGSLLFPCLLLPLIPLTTHTGPPRICLVAMLAGKALGPVPKQGGPAVRTLTSIPVNHGVTAGAAPSSILLFNPSVKANLLLPSNIV